MKTAELKITRRNGDVYTVLVDDADFERVQSAGPWYVTRSRETFYAQRTTRVDGREVTEQLHRFLLGLRPGDPSVDHRNGNALDNRRENLRLASDAENARNAQLRKDSTSGCKGVSWDKNSQRWHAYVYVDRRQVFLGGFNCKLAAFMVVGRARRQYHGEFANEGCHAGR